MKNGVCFQGCLGTILHAGLCSSCWVTCIHAFSSIRGMRKIIILFIYLMNFLYCLWYLIIKLGITWWENWSFWVITAKKNDIGLTHYSLWAKSGPLPILEMKFYCNTATLLIYILSMTLPCQNSRLETLCPAKPNIVTLCPITKHITQPLT